MVGRRNAGSRPGSAGGQRTGTARRELVENEIYEHAIRLFAERGFAGTSLQDIADALGITRPALYYYVKSKDELLAKLAADVAGGSAAKIAELTARADLDAVGKLREIVRVNVLRQAHQPERFRLLVRSDAYALDDDGHLSPTFDGPPPVVALDPKYYKSLADLERHFPGGAPSLRAARSLTVHGDVTFGAGVQIVGAGSVTGPAIVPDGCIIEP